MQLLDEIEQKIVIYHCQADQLFVDVEAEANGRSASHRQIMHDI
jgi:hypothetical protein